jgi:hypothetical protein
MQQTAQSYLLICILITFFKLFEDFVDNLCMCNLDLTRVDTNLSRRMRL